MQQQRQLLTCLVSLATQRSVAASARFVASSALSSSRSSASAASGTSAPQPRNAPEGQQEPAGVPLPGPFALTPAFFRKHHTPGLASAQEQRCQGRGLWHRQQQHAVEGLQWMVSCRAYASAAAAPSLKASKAAQQQQQQQGEELIIHPSAVQRLKELQAQQPAGRAVALRIEVEGGGCSGYQYKFSLETSSPSSVAGDLAAASATAAAAPSDAPPDRVFEVEGMRVVCDPDSFEMLRGSQVEFEDTLMRRAFVVGSNPNSEASCGCGSSFAAKMPPTPFTRPKVAAASSAS